MPDVTLVAILAAALIALLVMPGRSSRKRPRRAVLSTQEVGGSTTSSVVQDVDAVASSLVVDTLAPRGVLI